MSNCTDVTLYNIRTDTYSQLGKPILFLFNLSGLHQALAKVYFYVELYAKTYLPLATRWRSSCAAPSIETSSRSHSVTILA